MQKKGLDSISKAYPDGKPVFSGSKAGEFNLHLISGMESEEPIRVIIETRMILIPNCGLPRDYYYMRVTQGQVDEIGSHHLLTNSTNPALQREDRSKKRRLVSVINNRNGKRLMWVYVLAAQLKGGCSVDSVNGGFSSSSMSCIF
jgi:hypothetical protein